MLQGGARNWGLQGYALWGYGGVNARHRRLEFFGVIGLEPPRLRVILAQDIAPLGGASALHIGGAGESGSTAALTVRAPVLKHHHQIICHLRCREAAATT